VTRLIIGAVLLFGVWASPLHAGIRTVWALGDGDKVKRDAAAPLIGEGNAVWQNGTVHIFGARNEVVAFQLIVQSDGAGVQRLVARLTGLTSGAGARIAYGAPAPDPTDSVDRPIQIFLEYYMHVTAPTHASWEFAPGSAAAPVDQLGWVPVQLVPELARADRGGMGLRVPAGLNQGIWFEIYTGRDRPAGVYRGEIAIDADGATVRVPVELEILDFMLPDENSMHAMLYYPGDEVELYHGRNLDAAYDRLAHRHRVELVHEFDEPGVERAWPRFSGTSFTPARGYEGPGQGQGNRIVPRSFYGPGEGFDVRTSAWALADRWMTFLRAKLPHAITFLYMPDEPAAGEFARVRQLADNVHSSPGPGRDLPIFVTHKYVPGLDGAIDIWDTGPQGFDVDTVARERAKGRKYWFYNGSRPYSGTMLIDAPATDGRELAWAAFKHGVDVYFYWHAVHWRHNSQKQGERNQNVWANPITFDDRGQPHKPLDDQGFINGDGVLIYPGEEKLHPEEDRGVPGPVSTIQLANLRRGLQDHQYLTIARGRGLDHAVEDALAAIVPKVFSSAGDRVSFPEHGDPYDNARLMLGRAIASDVARREPVVAAAPEPQPASLDRPVLFGTPEADRILTTLQVFPLDNPWHEEIAGRPVASDSAAIIGSIGADAPLGYNLDMNFVIVPPGQPRVPVTITMYPKESDPGPFPIPANAPIENWPLAHNEDTGALPAAGITLEQFQRSGTGDRHLLVVDPGRELLHEFWQARLTDRGWEASQASTFDLASGAMRPEGWTSADAAGLPIFPAVVRYDEVARGAVNHALRVTVRRTRRGYVYPARHFASPLTDPTLPRMGERLRLRASFDTSGFPPHARVILEALKRYGMFVADNGHDWLLSISPDRRFSGLETLSRVKGSDFEVIVPTGPTEGPRAR
jgi:hypothetical protein